MAYIRCLTLWLYSDSILSILAATKQLYEMVQSARLSVCLSSQSIRHTFFTMFLSSHHHAVFRSYYHWQKWCPCKSHGQRPKIISTVYGPWLQFEIAYGYEMMHKAWRSIEEVPYCFFEVIHQISRSYVPTIDDLNPIWVRLLGWSQLSNPWYLPG